MPNYRDNLEDLDRKYTSCWVYLNGDFVRVRGFDANDDEITCVADLPPGSEFRDKIYHEEEHGFNFVPFLPETQFFNYVKVPHENPLGLPYVTGFMLVRLAKRQYKRSACTNIYAIHNPVFEISKYLNTPMQNVGIDYKIMMMAKDQNNFPDLTQAKELLPKHIALALAPNLLVSLSTQNDTEYCLHNHSGAIGVIEKEKKAVSQITIYHQPAYQEVKDYLFRTRQAMQFQVTCA